MKTFLLNVNMNNAAFQENGAYELQAVLDRVSRHIPMVCSTVGDVEIVPARVYPVRDTNGNTVGSWKISTDTFPEDG